MDSQGEYKNRLFNKTRLHRTRYWLINSNIITIPTWSFTLLALLLLSSIASAQVLPFRIIEQEQQKKGGSISPLRSPKYKLVIVKAALTDEKAKLTKTTVEATLRALLKSVRKRNYSVDGISAFLYQSPKHLKSGNLALGSVEWWPKGHSFSPSNAINIRNKNTYVVTIEVSKFNLPEKHPSPVSRLSEATRQEIFTEWVRIEDLTMKEAEKKYPIDGSNIPIAQLRTYDYVKAFDKYSTENDRLKKIYKSFFIEEYKISESELKNIMMEGLLQNWPYP